MANRYYTLLVVPEKTEKVRKLIIPRWLFRGGSIAVAFLILLTGVMIFDYSYVMSQIGENRFLKQENRRLRQQVQVFENKMAAVEGTVERMKDFSTRLKVIMHVEDEPPDLNTILPEANSNIPSGGLIQPIPQPTQTVQPLDTETSLNSPLRELRKETSELQDRMTDIARRALEIEEVLQDEYEILYDKKAFLAALPTRQPASGYFTSGFGIRRSPLGNRVKMHEGLDIANRIGTPVRATADGEVVYASPKVGYGLTVILDHGYGIRTLYGHLRAFTVEKGEKVRRGQKVALLGNSGRSTGPHVHYEVHVHGFPVDPLSYIFEDSAP